MYTLWDMTVDLAKLAVGAGVYALFMGITAMVVVAIFCLIWFSFCKYILGIK